MAPPTRRRTFPGSDQDDIEKKLILSFILLVLILGSVIGYFPIRMQKNWCCRAKEKEMADTINRIDISLNNWVDQVTTLAENIKENPMVTELMEEEGKSDGRGEVIPYLMHGSTIWRRWSAFVRIFYWWMQRADSDIAIPKECPTGSRPIGRTGNRDAGGDRR